MAFYSAPDSFTNSFVTEIFFFNTLRITPIAGIIDEYVDKNKCINTTCLCAMQFHTTHLKLCARVYCLVIVINNVNNWDN